jgi:hypothetical protein
VLGNDLTVLCSADVLALCSDDEDDDVDCACGIDATTTSSSSPSESSAGAAGRARAGAPEPARNGGGLGLSDIVVDVIQSDHSGIDLKPSPLMMSGERGRSCCWPRSEIQLGLRVYF